MKLFKWSITFLNTPEDGRNAALCHSGLTGWAPIPTEATSHFQALGNDPVGKKPDQKILTKRLTKGQWKMGPLRTLQMTLGWVQGGMCDWGIESPGRGQTVIPASHSKAQKSMAHTNMVSTQTFWHSPRCTVSHRMWQIVQQLSFWHYTKKNHGVAFVPFCEGQREIIEQKMA